MKLFRKIIFWCHLAAGVSAGIVILIMSVTGVLLAYERQLTAWADTRGYQSSPPSPSSSRLPVEALLAKVRESKPAAPTTITFRADRDAPAEVGFGREGTVFVNAYSGEVLGEGAKNVRSFFRVMTDWHRWLGASGNGAGHDIGRAITGASNLIFLFIVMSGFYLWWPRRWTRKVLRNVTWFKRGLPDRARNFNWHNVVGFWSAIPLFIVVLSSVVLSYTWASNLVYRVVGETPPAPRTAPNQPPNSGGPPQQPRSGPERSNESVSNALPPDALNQLWARAEQQQAGWRSISLRLPSAQDATATFTIDTGDGGQPQKRSQLTLDKKSGEVVRWEPFASYTTGRKLRSYLRFAHTGEVFGVPGQTIAGLVSAGGALLVWTGLALSWRRFRVWRAKGKAGATAAARSANGATDDNEEDYRGDSLQSDSTIDGRVAGDNISQ